MKGSIWKQGDKNLRLTEWDIPSVSRFSLSVAVCVVMPKSRNSNQQKKCWKIQPFQKKKLDFLELLGGFEPPTSSLPTAMAIFFRYFFLFIAVFALFYLLSDTLWKPHFHVFHTCLWLVMWSETLAALEFSVLKQHCSRPRKWSNLNQAALNRLLTQRKYQAINCTSVYNDKQIS